MLSPYLKQTLSNWTTQNRIVPPYWRGLVAVVLEAGHQLQWLLCRNLELYYRTKGMDIDKDHLIGEGQYANIQE